MSARIISERAGQKADLAAVRGRKAETVTEREKERRTKKGTQRAASLAGAFLGVSPRRSGNVSPKRLIYYRFVIMFHELSLCSHPLGVPLPFQRPFLANLSTTAVP